MPDTPVPPFGATRAGVTALLPDVTIYAVDNVPAGRRVITEPQVDGWLAELTARVGRRLDGWQRLSDTPPVDADGELSDREELILAARNLIHNGTASYVEAARHPEQAGKSVTSYADVLWQRFTDGLDELAAWLTGRLTLAGDPSEPGTGDAPGLAFAFPVASFTADLHF